MKPAILNMRRVGVAAVWNEEKDNFNLHIEDTLDAGMDYVMRRLSILLCMKVLKGSGNYRLGNSI
ncbi:MAG: hypothetical protein R2769_08340 [Saprospiraceae bacterium]